MTLIVYVIMLSDIVCAVVIVYNTVRNRNCALAMGCCVSICTSSNDDDDIEGNNKYRYDKLRRKSRDNIKRSRAVLEFLPW